LGLLDFFRRRPPIRDAAALAEFVDRQSAFLAQKGIYEYARARAGPYAKVLFGEQTFLDAVEQSRWRAYPLALALVTELVEGVLKPSAADRAEQLAALRALALSNFDRYPVPAILGDQVWAQLRAELAHRIDLIGLHPPKRPIDICVPWADAYFNLLPIHERLRARDYPTTFNYLRVTLCNIHDELTKRMDAAAIVESLAVQGP
jgi:hypothetical protein